MREVLVVLFGVITGAMLIVFTLTSAIKGWRFGLFFSAGIFSIVATVVVLVGVMVALQMKYFPNSM